VYATLCNDVYKREGQHSRGRLFLGTVLGSVENVNDFAARRFDEVYPVIEVHIPILGHGRTPVRGNGAELDIGWEPCADRKALPDRYRCDPFLHHVFLDAGALLRREADANADRPHLDTHLSQGRIRRASGEREATAAAASNARFIGNSSG
jgi:hypothetical protein